MLLLVFSEREGEGVGVEEDGEALAGGEDFGVVEGDDADVGDDVGVVDIFIVRADDFGSGDGAPHAGVGRGHGG